MLLLHEPACFVSLYRGFCFFVLTMFKILDLLIVPRHFPRVVKFEYKSDEPSQVKEKYVLTWVSITISMHIAALESSPFPLFSKCLRDFSFLAFTLLARESLTTLAELISRPVVS